MSKRILMPLMGLDIGGAETHVLELALELKRQGYYVVLASNGGVYEKELKEAGIPHYYVPLNTKKPTAIFKSYFALKKIVRDEKIDLIHAHGRIPAFVSGFVHEVTHVPFITTAHWVFSTKYGLRHLTNWGQKSIAVSEDIKDYLINEYGYAKSDISVTINGIDTSKFSKDIDYSDVLSEFSLSPDSFKIVYISRMDEDRAKVAFDLVNIAPRIFSRIPNLEIIVVGGGNVFDKLKDLANNINKQLGKRVVVLTGGRCDINKFTAMADIFVAVSRSALEAMSAEVPVIVAGNEGYIGIFEKSKLPVAIDTNFTCRGCPLPTEDMLFADIMTVYSSSKEVRAELGRYGKQIISEQYSVSRMADDAISVYSHMLDTPAGYDAIISGYYGFKNSGDDALLLAVIQRLRKIKPDIRLCVLSKEPLVTQEEHNVDSINRYSYFKIYKTMKQTKMLISGGGSLLHDVNSTKSILYYTTIMQMAQHLGLKTMLYANGIGPILKPLNQKRTRRILNKTDCITLRERSSLNVLKSLGVNKPLVYVAADPALTLEPADTSVIAAELTRQKIDLNRYYFGVSIREWKDAPQNFKQTIANTLDYIYEKYNITPMFIPMMFPDDVEYSEKIADICKNKYPILKKHMPISTMIGVVGHLDFMLGMRLHSVIYSTSHSVPTIGIVYDPKVKAYMTELKQSTYLDIKALNLNELKELSDRVIASKNEISQSLDFVISREKKKCMISDRIVLELLDGSDLSADSNLKEEI